MRVAMGHRRSHASPVGSKKKAILRAHKGIPPPVPYAYACLAGPGIRGKRYVLYETAAAAMLGVGG